MSLKDLRRTNQTTDEGAQLQSAVSDFARQLTLNPLLGPPAILKGVTISGSAMIPHGLQRPVQGWIITRIKSNSVIYETASTDKYLTLAASAPAVVDIYIF